MIYDRDFLKKLDSQSVRTIFAKIVALDFNEYPLEEITGKVTSGSINIDGSSAVRRTCQLSMVSDTYDYRKLNWAIKTKISLSIGLLNTVDKQFPEIIWFPEGVYVITSISTSASVGNFTINISGKDKMCLLNGELGGQFIAETPLDKEILQDGTNGDKILLSDIIRTILHLSGGELYQNILINDLDTPGIELLEYRYNQPLFLCRSQHSKIFSDVTLYGNQICYLDKEKTQPVKLKDLSIDYLDMLIDPLYGSTNPKLVYFEINENQIEPYYVARIDYGQTAGYRLTPLVFAGDLIAKTGESITSILDKIKNMLGAFEYFYDVNGKFHFQKKKIYVKSSWAFSEFKETELETTKELLYNLDEGQLVTALSNQPRLNDIKNDYIVWGKRKTPTGGTVPIHYRYVLGRKPTQYITYKGVKYSTEDWDWRELIYQMALDEQQYSQESNFFTIINQHNPDFPYGHTGYEYFYTDFLGFWRQLYNPKPEPEEENKYFSGKEEHSYWAKQVFYNPEALNFWFDILESNLNISQFNLQNIGDRPKVVNDNQISGIYFKETPSVIFVDSIENIPDTYQDDGYKYIQVKSMDQMVTISPQGKSAKSAIDDLIFKHGYLMDSISITSLPIYYLEPNRLLYINDLNTQLHGTFVINKISLPLTYNGTMSITAMRSEEENDEIH